MFLYIFSDNSVRRVEENPTVVDLLAVSQGLLTIIKFDKRKGFLHLVKDESKLIWVPVKEAKMVSGEEGRLHT